MALLRYTAVLAQATSQCSGSSGTADNCASTRISQLKSERGANLEERRHPSVQFQSLFWCQLAASICLTLLRTALTAAAFSEAECIVFAAEGLLLAHGFPFNCGIRVQRRQRTDGYDL